MENNIENFSENILKEMELIIITLKKYIQKISKKIKEEEIIERLKKIQSIIEYISLLDINKKINTPKEYDLQINYLVKENHEKMIKISNLESKLNEIEELKTENLRLAEKNDVSNKKVSKLIKKIRNDNESNKYKEMIFFNKFADFTKSQSLYEKEFNSFSTTFFDNLKHDKNINNIKLFRSYRSLSEKFENLKNNKKIKNTMNNFYLYQKNKNIKGMNNYIYSDNISSINKIISEQNKQIIPTFQIKNNKKFYEEEN